jgi:hypothetical protein
MLDSPPAVALEPALDALEPALDALEPALDALEPALDAPVPALDALEPALVAPASPGAPDVLPPGRFAAVPALAPPSACVWVVVPLPFEHAT